MGIDIYAVWNGQTEEEKKGQFSVWLSGTHGRIGYLREAYRGEPYVTRFLFREAFASETNEARIPAETLRARLPEGLKLVEQREREIYHETDPREIDSMKHSYEGFVALCEMKERESGVPVLIRVSY
jgi:hypothetical protein